MKPLQYISRRQQHASYAREEFACFLRFHSSLIEPVRQLNQTKCRLRHVDQMLLSQWLKIVTSRAIPG